MNVSQFVSSDNFNMAEFNDMISQINSGVNSEVAALTTLINSGAKIQTGSYTGTGTYGESNPCSLTFDFVPKFMVMLAWVDASSNPIWKNISGDDSSAIIARDSLTSAYQQGIGFSVKRYSGNSYGRLNGSAFEWYSNYSAVAQCNATDCTYCYAAIG